MAGCVHKSGVNAVGMREQPPLKYEDSVGIPEGEGDRILSSTENGMVECVDSGTETFLLWPSPYGSSQ